MNELRNQAESSLPTSHGRWARVLLWGLVLLPFFLQAAYFPSYGHLQSDDYHGVIERLSDGERLSRDPGTWFTIRIVQHRVTVPSVFWGLNLLFFDGSNQPMALLSLIILVAIFLIVLAQLRESVAYPSAEFWPLAAVASILVFAPINGTNLAISFQGIHFFLCNLFAVLSILVLVRGWRYRLIWLALLGLLGLLTFSSAMAYWPVLVVGAVLLRRGKGEVAALAALGLAALLVWTRGRMPGTGAYSVSPDPELILRYLATFFGATFTRDPTIARFVGWIGMTAAVVALAVALWRRRLGSPEAFWVMLQGYAFSSALMAALGRSAQNGEVQAMSPRYGHYPALFWLGLLVFIGLLIKPQDAASRLANWRPAMLLSQWIAVGLISVYTFQVGINTIRYLASRGARQVVTDLAFRLSAQDEQLVRETVSHKPKSVIAKIPVFRDLQHTPFDRPAPPLDWPEIPPELVQAAPHPEIVGEIKEIVTTEHPTWTRVR
ncbi:MAG: hypothetical protein AAF657_08030, partial [Acidobacteriota bacterium]